jgi:hypothetical protein
LLATGRGFFDKGVRVGVVVGILLPAPVVFGVVLLPPCGVAFVFEVDVLPPPASFAAAEDKGVVTALGTVLADNGVVLLATNTGLLSLLLTATAEPTALNLLDAGGGGDLALLKVEADSTPLAALGVRLLEAVEDRAPLLLGIDELGVVVGVVVALAVTFFRPAMGSRSGDREALGIAPLVLLGVTILELTGVGLTESSVVVLTEEGSSSPVCCKFACPGKVPRVSSN